MAKLAFMFALSCFVLLHGVLASSNVSQSTIQHLQHHVVSIKTRAPIAAYSGEGTSSGSGCIVGSGIIVTNAHVVGEEKIARYEVTLHDGQELEAWLLYVDPWLDIAFLKVHSENLPAPVSLESSLPTIGQPVLIIGKNENMHFSTQTGTVANPYESVTVLPGQVFRISLNAQGGASGSPVFDQNGKMIGLVLASNNVTSAFAYPVSYVENILKYLSQGKMPPRFGVGALAEYVSADTLVRYYGFSKVRAEQYRQKFPGAFNRMLVVKHILQGSPADGKLHPGDVILRVNGQDVGPSLYDLDTCMNLGGPIVLEIIRQWHEVPLSITVPSYNLQEKQIKRMVIFGGAVFYQADDAISRRTGVKGHPVFFTNIRPGSSFYERLPVLPKTSSTLVSILKLGDHLIETLDDVIEAIPQLIKKKDFVIQFKNYGLEFGFDQLLFFNQSPQNQEITYARQDGLPEVYTWNPRKLRYDVHTILRYVDSPL